MSHNPTILPIDWSTGWSSWTVSHVTPEQDLIAEVQDSADGSIRILCQSRSGAGRILGGMKKTLDVALLAGRRVRLSGWASTQGFNGDFYVRLRAKTSSGWVGDCMRDRSIRSRNGTHPIAIVMDLPSDTESVGIQLELCGQGTVTTHGLLLEIVAAEIPTTDEGIFWIHLGRSPVDYRCGYQPVGGSRSRIRWIQSAVPIPKGFGTYMCGTDATHLRGHKVQVQTRVRSHSVDSACLWLRVDLHTDEPAGYRLLAFDNMYLRGIRGTTPWHEARIVLDVPEEATHIAWGMILDGNGRFEAEEFAPEVAPPEAASTCMLLKEQDPGYRRIYEIKQELDELRQLVSTRSDSSRVSRPAFHWAARTRPATELGGDTFLIRLLENNQLLVFLCDVAGHGLSASLVAASCRGVVWQSARSVPFEGAALLSSLNDLVREHTVRPRPLASTCLMLIDTDSGLWRGWLNGTPNPVAVDRTGTSLPLFTGSGLPIGALSRPTLHEETGQLAPGERILLHTDGLIEVVSPSGTQWAETGLENALLHGVRTSLQRQLDRVFRSVDLHQGSTPQQDDQTLIMIERRRESNRPRPIRHIKSL